MDWLEYQTKAVATVNPKLTWDERIINGALGLCGETGEIADSIKKWKMQGHQLDTAHLKMEIGDCLWYLNLLADCLGLDLEEIAQANIDKLYKRYKDGNFSTEQSINRA